MHIAGNELRGHLAMLAFSGLVAGSFALGVKVANDITPAAFTLIRFVIAVSILATVLLIKTEFTKKFFKAPWRFFVLGGCIAIYFVLMFEGLKIASSVSLAAVFTFAPLLSGLFGYIFVRQKMSLSIFTALVIGAIGALWVVFEGNFQRLIMLEFGLGEMVSDMCMPMFTTLKYTATISGLFQMVEFSILQTVESILPIRLETFTEPKYGVGVLVFGKDMCKPWEPITMEHYS